MASKADETVRVRFGQEPEEAQDEALGKAAVLGLEGDIHLVATTSYSSPCLDHLRRSRRVVICTILACIQKNVPQNVLSETAMPHAKWGANSM